ncbi:pore-forming ESAT-6 family protein [Nesterenkonia flava]|uniref:Pore-forming ESAT-6 family protein n=1 Tax=Nesterenkonia flava TaxID=469799 RepID=A0ABU1FQL5_9MICC|nr:pore-forming ESAT-6 family protein [Nesterenkonia flava]MDR5710945.1 pore-forming ESAT-6 family protein [Nesterenkonia flava]
MSLDRISFNTDTSAEVQGNIQRTVSNLESLIAERDQQVMEALSDFQMDGADAEYHAVESRWSRASNEVKAIISLVRETLIDNDQVAQNTQQKTMQAIQSIG